MGRAILAHEGLRGAGSIHRDRHHRAAICTKSLKVISDDASLK